MFKMISSKQAWLVLKYTRFIFNGNMSVNSCNAVINWSTHTALYIILNQPLNVHLKRCQQSNDNFKKTGILPWAKDIN